MYWFNSLASLKRFFFLSIFIAGLTACSPAVPAKGSEKRYFDLRQFMTKNWNGLNANKELVLKTVKHNGDFTQSKKLRIDNWAQELDLFAASDINKPAWRDSYSTQHKGDSIVYTALNPDLVTRRLVILTKDKQVKRISVQNFTKNLLYQTTENLVYYPDSLYYINKLQKVRLIGTNQYIITGQIK